MAHHYGDTPTSNPITFDEDVAYMASRWARIAEQARLIVVEGSLVSLSHRQRDALDHASAWRYDIGMERIECLFVFEDSATTFLETGRWTIIADHPAKVHRLPLTMRAIMPH